MFAGFGVEDETYILRPMNCPHHIRIFQHDRRSYRELPMRIGELGTVYRYEKSGELSGLMRVRGFTINDAHIFCTEEQVKQEFIASTRLILDLYAALKIEDFTFRLSLHDDSEKFMGDPAAWELAEEAIRGALREVGHPFEEAPGEAAFYGPKLDVQIRDALGREFSASTTQLDFILPERFGLEYAAHDGSMRRPAMIHRAPIGSLERFFAFLIEHFAGDFPLWIAPVQLVLIPISDKNLPYVEGQAAFFREHGLRVEVDSRPERMQAKIRDAELQKIPYVGVCGGRDEEAGRGPEGGVNQEKNGEGGVPTHGGGRKAADGGRVGRGGGAPQANPAGLPLEELRRVPVRCPQGGAGVPPQAGQHQAQADE